MRRQPAHPNMVAPPCEVESEDDLILLWLHGMSANTQKNYGMDIEDFFNFVKRTGQCPRRIVRWRYDAADVKAYLESLGRSLDTAPHQADFTAREVAHLSGTTTKKVYAVAKWRNWHRRAVATGKTHESVLARVTLRDLQGYDSALAARGLSPSSRCRKLSSVRSLFNFGCLHGYLHYNPTLIFRMPKAKDTLAERIMSENQVRQILETAHDRCRPCPKLTRHFYSTGEVTDILGLSPGRIQSLWPQRGWKRVGVWEQTDCLRQTARFRYDAADVERYLASLSRSTGDTAKKKGYTAREAAHLAGVNIKTVYERARRQGWSKRPIAQRERARENHREKRLVWKYARDGLEIYAREQQMKHHRDFALLIFLYSTGARISEALSLRAHDLRPASKNQGLATLFGKGDKTRHVKLPVKAWLALSPLVKGRGPDTVVFRSTKGDQAITREHTTRIVKDIALEAGMDIRPSPHWFRHSHASHALENGAPIHLVQATLGHASLTSTERYLHANPEETSGNFLPILDEIGDGMRTLKLVGKAAG